MRGDYLARQWRIIKAIAAASQGLTASQLADSEQVQLRTVYRDLESLQSAGFPLYSKRDGRSTKWFLVDPVKGKGLPAPYTVAEIIALWLAKNLLHNMPDPALHTALDSLFYKFTSSLVPSSFNKIAEIQKSFEIVRPDEETVKIYAQKIDLINQMVLAKKRMRIKFKPGGQEEIREMLIDPYRTWYYESNWYLMAYSHDHQKTMMLPIENIQETRLLPEDCAPDLNFEIGDFMRDVCAQVITDKFRVRVRLSPLWQELFGDENKSGRQTRAKQDMEMEVSFKTGLSSEK
ncbi:MAG: WYL domain-containing protein [Desulfarculales bacterium]|jgi:predicted DNA-binding transcriptional regulator YafY|nr:WYL domain-containing protein [Desulfarculales bacterium]